MTRVGESPCSVGEANARKSRLKRTQGSAPILERLYGRSSMPKRPWVVSRRGAFMCGERSWIFSLILSIGIQTFSTAPIFPMNAAHAASLSAKHVQQLIGRGAFGKEFVSYLRTDEWDDIREMPLPLKGIQLFQWNAGEVTHFLVVDHGKYIHFYSHLGIGGRWDAELLRSGNQYVVRLLLPNPLGMPERPQQFYWVQQGSRSNQPTRHSSSVTSEMLFVKVEDSRIDGMGEEAR